MECAVCLQYWNQEDCVPKSLPCGHSFCSQCLESIFTKRKTGVQCPNCLVDYKMTIPQVQAIPKNFALLCLIPNKHSKTFLNTVSKQMIRGSKHERCFSEEYIEKLITTHPNCDKHKMPLHSYSPETNQLVCDGCIIELPNSIPLKPIPKVK